MGHVQSVPPELPPEEAQAARERYKRRLSQALTVPVDQIHDVHEESLCLVVAVSGEAAATQSERLGFSVRPHFVIITHSAWRYGVEFYIRLEAQNLDACLEVARTIQDDFSLYLTMHESTRFFPYETAQAVQWSFSHDAPGQGDKGMLFLPEKHLLMGINWSPDDAENDFDLEGRLHDEDYWPQHFLLSFPLSPVEYFTLRGVRNEDVARILEQSNPLFMTSIDRPNFVDQEPVASRLTELRESTPAKTSLDGLSLDLRVRQQGMAVDIVMGGRWMAPLLLALNQAFDKESVPLGTVVTAESDGHQCIAVFQSHHPDGTPVTAETATFFVEPLGFQGEDIPEDEAQQRAFCLLPPCDLYTQRGLIRRMAVEFFLPKEMLITMLGTVQEVGVFMTFQDLIRQAVLQRENNFDEVPMIVSWPEQYPGTAPVVGFRDVERPSQEPATIRFICAGQNYFEDEVKINDDGDFEPVGAQGNGNDELLNQIVHQAVNNNNNMLQAGQPNEADNQNNNGAQINQNFALR